MRVYRYIVWMALVWLIAQTGLSISDAATVTNTATGTLNGNSLDLSRSTVNLNRTGTADPNRSTVTADPIIITADGVSRSTLTTILRDINNYLISGKSVVYFSDRLAGDIFDQPSGLSDANGTATGYIRSAVPGKATITATETTDNVVITMKPVVYFTQGQVLEITKTANKKEAVVGDVVTYLIEIKNRTDKDVIMVKIDDMIPPNFKYLKGSARLNGQKLPDPAGNRTLTFDVGTVPALSDKNGNGKADKGEAGYFTLSYQLIIGSGATPRDYINTAFAKDVCDQCYISNTDDAKVTVTLDPIFDLGTIIGKVFDDKNGNGFQDKDEQGVPSAMVALDDGTYALTDEHGRYHFPAVRPGHRMVKMNIESLPDGMATTSDDSKIVSVTPGLLAKANFGVQFRQEMETIGRPPVMGVSLKNDEQREPIQVVGSTETMTVLVNGKQVRLPSGEMKLNIETLEEVVEIKGNIVNKPIDFQTSVESPGSIRRWRFTMTNENGEVVRTMEGTDAPAEHIEWDAKTDEGKMVEGGQVYQYQMEADYADGSRSSSPRRVLGVNKTTAISLSMTGSAFKSGTDLLSDRAQKVLGEIAEIMRQYPDEKIYIEGHTDNVGSAVSNLDLSKRRARAAATYLISNEGLSDDRFVINGYGKSRPVASNSTPEGRELNRRVEIKGETQKIEKSKVQDQFRAEPYIEINDSPLKTDKKGRFSATYGEELDSIKIEIGNPRGSRIETSVPVPRLEMRDFRAEKVMAYGASDDGLSVFEPGNGGDAVAVLRVAGRTDPGNKAYIDGEQLHVDAEGNFRPELNLRLGRNEFGLMLKNEQGFTRIATLTADLSDRDKNGRLIVVIEPIPNLTVKLPPKDVPLRTPNLAVSGVTDPGNALTINGEPVDVRANGEFMTNISLKTGLNKVSIQAKDPEGHTGAIEREIEVTNSRLFLMAFADGKVGQMQGSGYLKGAGMEKSEEFYTEGRVAYYLKGYVAGKYLVTSAFDTGTREFGKMFKDLDRSENDRLFTNLDPDKLYPVYGDSSTIVYDIQSQGKFYLAVDSDELHVVMGNYQLSMSDTELAAYNRTLYGAKASYQSLARTKYGQPETTALVFGAEVRQAHARDEMRATGGSLYYLSHRDVIEGSEQVTLEIRDKNTGLVLSRMPQQQNVDYNVKYSEGRILFNRPISSVAESSSLVNQSILAGNPVYVMVDYETTLDSFEKTAGGGRVRKQLGDHLAIGGTYIKDELSSGVYEMQGVDAEVRVGKNTRLIAEQVKTSGTNSVTFVSDDGGLTYKEVTPTGFMEGEAWKVAAEVDAGEWVEIPDRFFIGGYIKRLDEGFASSGNFLDHGTEKSGAGTKLHLTGADTLIARFDQERLIGGTASNISSLTESKTTSLQLTHDKRWWSITGEYQGKESQSGSGSTIEDSGYGAARLRLNPTEKLSLKVERQETLRGPENNQTTVGMTYQILKSLALSASATEGTIGRSAQGGLTLNLDNGKIYLTERVNDDRAGHSSSTIVGAESAIDGTSRIYTEYQWERADQGNRNLSIVGAQKRWDMNKGWSFILTGEHSKIEAEPVPTTRYTIGAGTSYKTAGFSFLTRGEERKEEGAQDKVQYLTVNNVEVKMSPDFTFLAKYRYSITRNLTTDSVEAEFEERGIGLAYRPVDNDSFNAIARYTWLSDRRPMTLGETDWTVTTANVMSAEWSYEITRSVEWVEKETLKIKTENTGDRDPVTTHTYLGIHRINLNAWKKMDLGIEYRMLKQMEADDQREGWLTEVMWQVVKNMRFGVGFNFTNFSDNEFSENNYSVYGWFIRFQGRY